MALNIAFIAQEKELPNFDLYYRDEKNKIQADRINIVAFLTSRGFYLFRTSVNKHIFIRIMDNIVCEVGKKDLIDSVLYFVHENESRTVHEAFLTNVTKFFNDDFLRTLPAKQIEFRKDKKDAIQIYYQNCIVKITPTKITTHPYTDLNGYIWESQILTREFNIESSEESHFKQFIFNISNQDNKRYLSICTMMGFLIHNYKNPGYCPAVILNDEVISDNPEGGTGKGILINAIQQFMRTTVIEGKTFSFDKNFVYQDVNSDTKIIAFQDVNKSFDFERLFAVLTDGINVEKKAMQSVHFDFDNSPKIIISTNRAIRGSGNSHKRRRFEVEISQYYNGSRTPLDEFGKMFFKEWTIGDYNKFDMFICNCCQAYLRNGLVKQDFVNLPEKQLRIETNDDFLEFMENRQLEKIAKSDFYNQFISEYPEMLKHRYFSKQILTKWLRIYAAYKGYKIPEIDYIYLSVRYYTFEKITKLN